MSPYSLEGSQSFVCLFVCLFSMTLTSLRKTNKDFFKIIQGLVFKLNYKLEFKKITPKLYIHLFEMLMENEYVQQNYMKVLRLT